MDQGHSTKRKGGHLKFHTKLASQLMAHSSSSKYTSPADGFRVHMNLASYIMISQDGCSGIHEMISQDTKECKAYMAQGWTAQVGRKRKDLYKLSENSVRSNQDGEKLRRPQPPRTKYGCSVCQVHLYKERTCWEEHIRLSKVID